MEKTEEREKENKIPGTKKPYQSPSLVCYGAIKELTRGGSGTKTESGGGGPFRRP